MNTSKTIKFLLMGDEGVGKTSLKNVYLKNLNFDLPYHDHRIDKQRYQIDVIEILSFDQLQKYNIYENEHDIIINVLCFSVAERKTLATLRRVWIPEVMNLNKTAKMFLMGLQCDLREQFLYKWRQSCFSHEEGIQVCLLYERIYYVECSSAKLISVKEAFDRMLEIYLYEDYEKLLVDRMLRLCNAMQIKFEFYGKIEWLKDRVEAMNYIDDYHPDEESFGIDVDILEWS